ncbi:MAG: RtcB family protein [Atopobiaceae bacterium]|nr:RtcB family protein [Atopobiaceae bacterium]
MFTIEGSYETATCFATSIEDAAIEQIRAMCNQPFTKDAHVRIMPDAHAGAGCTIGTTMHVTDKVVPNIVGVDIGCGMYTVNLGCTAIDLPTFDEACHAIPSGFEVWDDCREHFDLTELHCHQSLRDIDRLQRSLGTLGGGNHFIEIDRALDGTNYLVIHSGSRNLGVQVASLYQRQAVNLHKGKGAYAAKRDELIEAYKTAGRSKEIQSALAQLEANPHEPDVPAELCWLHGSYLDDYLADVTVCQRFARQNRELMATELIRRCGLTIHDAFHTIHNYIDTNEMILRKGAIAAHKNELVLIPLNMRDGSVLARGKGNADWNYSAPHGAGRALSRKAAKEQLSLDDYRKQMANVYTTSINEATLDEAPDAYKSAKDILQPIAEAVDVLEVLHPIYNFKAS